MAETCRIKFCGLRTETDVEVACACGVWAVGFVFTESPRRVDPDRARALVQAVEPGVETVGLFTHEPLAEVRRVAARLGLDRIQIHRVLSPAEREDCADLPLLPVFRVQGPESLAALAAVRGGTFLLDTYVPGVAGGTGERFDWTLARRAAAWGRVVLAGGLTPENVGAAVAVAAPWGVDVSGGIEASRGVKDHSRMRAFAAAVRST